jgi:hypothetical protein
MNGKAYEKSWFAHKKITEGSTLVFKMGDKPNKAWGSAKASRPSTEPFRPFVTLPYAVTKDEYFLHTGKLELKCDEPGAVIRFATDGSEPTESSPVYKQPIVVNQTTFVRFTAFKEGTLSSVPVSVKLTKLKFKDYTNYEHKMQFAPGLEYKYYEAHVISPSELDDLKPVKTGIISRITVDERGREDYFGYIFSGYLKIPGDGIYYITISSNDGNTFYLDGKEFRGGAIALRKGMYKILQKYFQLGNKKWDIVTWEGPGIKKQEIPPGAYFHQKTSPE